MEDYEVVYVWYIFGLQKHIHVQHALKFCHTHVWVQSFFV